MTDLVSSINKRIKEVQQKAIEQQEQREKLRHEQIEKINEEASKEKATKIHEAMKEKEREMLDKYTEHLPRRLELYMAQQRAQHNGLQLNPKGMGLGPIVTATQESRLLDNSIKMLELGQNRYVTEQTKDLRQEWNTLTGDTFAKQAEYDRHKCERDKLVEHGLDKMAVRTEREGSDPYAALKQHDDKLASKPLPESNPPENEKPKTLKFFEDLYPSKGPSHDFER
jgi:hypothetical protein